MDTLKKIEKLFEQACGCPAPVFRVSDRVIDELAVYEPPRLIPLSIFAGVSAAAAVLVFMLGVHAWSYMSNPFMELVSPLQETPLW